MQVHRRIEITVEREIVSVLVPGRLIPGMSEQGLERAGPECGHSDFIQTPSSVLDKT
jgi:hypothetical protein